MLQQTNVSARAFFPVDKLGTSQNTPPDKVKKCYQGISRPESNKMGTWVPAKIQLVAGCRKTDNQFRGAAMNGATG
jgi:hypothetical protein